MTKSPWVVKIQAALSELASEFDSSLPETTFVFHPLYRVGVSEKSVENIEKIFGKSFLGRLRHYSGNLKKMDWLKYGRKKFVARLPSDSIIFFRSDKEGVIVASHEKQIAFKIFFDGPHIELLEEEIRTLKSFENTSFSPYVAKLLADGRTRNGGRWLVTNFCSNSEALTSRPHHERYLLRYFPMIVMPAMTQFYQSFSPRILSLERWLLETHYRIERHPSRKKLEVLIKKIAELSREFPDYEVVESRIHHDLHAGNILIDDNQTIIIDWEGSVRGLVLIDVFDFTRRFLQKSLWDKWHFSLYMRGIVKEPPILIKRSLRFYRNWSLINFKINIAPGSARLTFMIYAVERALILHELRGLDRFKDRKGIESWILKAVQ